MMKLGLAYYMSWPGAMLAFNKVFPQSDENKQTANWKCALDFHNAIYKNATITITSFNQKLHKDMIQH